MNTVDRARGRWREILPRLGLEPQFLVKKHGPCPLCGGKDRFRTTVVARRFGEALFPVDVLTTFSDGSKKTERWDGVERRMIYRYDSRVRARSVEIDPNHVLMLDVNYTNNSRTLQPRAGEASLKWSLKWMAWLQDVLVTYAWLV